MTTLEGFGIRPFGFDGLPSSWSDADLRLRRTYEAAEGSRDWARRIGDPAAVRLTRPDGAYFSVEGDTDMSEGRGGRYEVGRYLDPWAADAAASGKAAQDGFGYTSIMVPYQEDLTVTGVDGETVVLSTSTAYRPGRLDGLMVEQ